VHEFLACLVKVEDQLTRPTVDVVNPLQATSGRALENGFKVVNKLGAGATAVAFWSSAREKAASSRSPVPPTSTAASSASLNSLNS